MDDAAALAEAALVYKNVGDGIDDVSVATESLISTIKAFGYEASDAMSIVDMFNEVGNNFAISSSGIGEALQRSASALAEAGNTLEESIGLVTAMNTVVQDPDSVGTALKTLTMYLRAAKTEAESAGVETEGMADSVATLRQSILSLTGVDIMIDADTFKSTYEIIREIANVWDDLTDTSRSNVLNLLGGKRNANVISSLIQNFSDAEAAMNSAMNSFGSATIENEKYLDSINGKIAVMKASFEEMSSSILSSGVIKFFIELATALENIVTWLVKVNQLGTAIVGIVAGVHTISGYIDRLKQVDKISSAFRTMVGQSESNTTAIKALSIAVDGLTQKQKTQLSSLITNSSAFSHLTDEERATVQSLLAVETATAATNTGIKKLTGGLQSLWSATSKFNKIAIIIAAITAVIGIVKTFVEANEEARQKSIDAANDIIDAYSDAQSSAKSNIQSLESLRSKFEKLSAGVDQNGKNVKLTANEYEEYESIVSQIIQLSPSVVSGYDAEGRAIVNYTTLLDDAISAQNTYLENTRNMYLGSGKDLFDGKAEEYRDVQKELGKAGEALGDAIARTDWEVIFDSIFHTKQSQNKLDTWKNALKEIGAYVSPNETWETAYDDLATMYERREDLLTLLTNSGQYDTTEIEEIRTALYGLAGAYTQLSSIETDQIDYLMEWAKDKEWYGNLPAQALDDFRIGLASVNDPLATFNENIAATDAYGEEFAAALASDGAQTLVEMARGLADGSVSIEEYNEAFNDFISSYTGSSGVVIGLSAFFSGLSNNVQVLGDSAEQASTEVTGLSDALQQLKKGYDLLSTAESEMADGGGISTDTLRSIADMLEEGEKLTDYITVENGLLELNTEKWKERSESIIRQDITALEAQKAEIEELIAARDLLALSPEDQGALGVDSKEVQAARYMVAGYSGDLEGLDDRLAEVTAEIAIYNAALDGANAEEDPLNLAGMFEGLDDVSGDADALLKALESLKNGAALTQDELVALAAQYPELMNNENFLSTTTVDAQKAILDELLATYESAYDDIIDAQITLLEQAKSNIGANSADALAIQTVIDNLETLKGLTVEDLYGSEQADAAKERYEDLENTISQISNAADILSDIRSGDGDPISILKDLIDIAQEYEDVDLSNFMSFGADGIQFNETGIETWIDSVIDATEGLDLLEKSFPGITEWLKKNAKENIETASTYDTLSDAISDLQSAAKIVQQIRDGESSLEILSSIIELAEKSGKDVTEFISGFDEINGITYNIDALNAAMDESANGLAVLEEKFPGISAYLKEHATDIDETVSAYDALRNAISSVKTAADLLTEIRSGEGDTLSMLESVVDMAEQSGQDINDFFNVTDGAFSFNEDAIVQWATGVVSGLEGVSEIAPETRQALIDMIVAETEAAVAADGMADAHDRAQQAIESMADAAGYTQLTYEAYQSLIDTDARYATAVEYQNGVMTLNSEKHAEVTQEILNETRAMAQAEKQAILTSDEYKELANALSMGTIDDNGLKRLADLNAQIKGFDVLTNEIDNATSAYARWVNRRGDDGMDRHSQALDAVSLINDTVNHSESQYYGRIGRTEFRQAVDFVLGENVEVNTPEFDRALELANRYLTDGAEGAANFYDDLVGAGLLDSTTGAMDSTIAEISSALGISEEMVRTMIDRLNEYQTEANKIQVEEPEIEASETESELNQVIQSLEDAQTYIQGINDTPLAIAINDSETTLEQVSAFESALDAIQEAIATISATPLAFNITDLEAAVVTVSRYIEQIQSALSQDGEGSFAIDTSDSTASLNELSSAAQRVHTALVGITTTLQEVIQKTNVINSTVLNIKTGNSPSLLGTVSSKLGTIISQLNTIRSRGSITVRINEVTTKTTINRSIGSAVASGLSYANGTAMAAGGRTLVGELGMETVVDPSTNRWYTVGERGAEFVKLPEGAIVFNHKQTEELFGVGRIGSRGNALVSGNAAVNINDPADSLGSSSNWVKKAADKVVSAGVSAVNKVTKAVSDSVKSATSKSSTSSSGSSSSSKKKSSKSSSKSSSSSKSLEKLKEQYQEINDQLEHLIDHQEFLYTQAEKGYNFKGMESSLEEQASLYKKKMENAQAAVKAMQAKGAKDTSEELQAMEKLYWDAYSSMYETLSKLNDLYVDGLNEKIDNIQQAYNNLASTAEEFNSSGISVDTFQSLIKNGVQYLSLLENIDGQFVINREGIEKMIALEKEQLAIESALSYVNQIKQLLADGNTNALARMVDLSGQISNNTWDAVYAQAGLLKAAGLSEEQFRQVVKNIDALRAIASGVSTALSGSETQSTKDVYSDQKSALEEILKLTEDLIKYETDEKIDAIEDQIDAYQKIIDLKKESLKADKEEDDYEKNIADRVKEIAKIQSQIDQLSLDDSREAQAKRAALIEQRDELQEDLASEQSDHAYDAKIDALDKMADDYEASRNEEIEALENSISSAEKIYQLAIERLNSSWDTLYEDLIQWNTEAGSSLNSEITENWLKAAEAVKQYGSYVAAVTGTENAIERIENGEAASDVVANGTLTDPDSILPPEEETPDPTPESATVKKVKIVKGKWNIRTGASTKNTKILGTAHTGDVYEYADETKGSWFKIIYKGREAWVSDNGSKIIEEVQKYHSGGKVGDKGSLNDQEVLAVLKKNEMVLTEKQTSGLYRIIDFQKMLAEKLGHAIGSIASPITSMQPAFADSAANANGASISEHFVFNPTITVEISQTGSMNERDAIAHGAKIANTAIDLLQEAFSRRGIATLGGNKLKQ